MENTDPEFFLLPSPSVADDGINHIVGNFQHTLRRLHIKAPTALCGVPMTCDEPVDDVALEGRPTCPECAAKSGWIK